jgi:hypothetical protein
MRLSVPASNVAAMTASFRSVAPVLPVRDLDAAQAHYAALGFSVRVYGHGTTYGFANRGDVELHMCGVGDTLDPKTSLTSVFLFVDDADALFAEWSAAGVPGKLVAPLDTEYGQREGSHVDPDGNVLRFGHPIPFPK